MSKKEIKKLKKYMKNTISDMKTDCAVEKIQMKQEMYEQRKKDKKTDLIHKGLLIGIFIIITALTETTDEGLINSFINIVQVIFS